MPIETPPNGINIMEATAPAERPVEAISQLRDIAERYPEAGR